MRIKINNLLSKCLILAMMLGLSSYAMAQRTITGTVTDDRGDAVISATVQVKGTTVGTTTDLDGKYSINVPEGSNVLVFTYIGYATQSVALGASNVLDVVMTEDTEVLDEVVVVGYGTQTRKEVTSAVSSVKAEDFNQGNVQDPVQLVQGKVAGLAISNPNSGDPNANSTIRLRGLSSFGANQSPLVIIDGIIGGALNSVDPSDIASIDVLKDASAAAIYGTRASAGVILITTKKGQGGKTTVSYNGFVTTESIDRAVPVATAAEYRQFNPNIAQDDKGASTVWLDEVTRTGLTQVHNVSLGGSIGKTGYRASFNFRDAQGILRDNGFTQLNGRLNLSQKALNDKLTVDLNIAATNRDASFGFSEALRYATLYNPTAPVTIAEGEPNFNQDIFDKYGGYYQAENFDYFNPVAIVEQGTNVGNYKTLLISGKATYEIVEGLTASAMVSQQKQNNVFGSFYNNNAYFRGFGRQGLASRNSEDITNSLFEATANYNKEFGSSKLSVLAGYSFNEVTGENFGVTAGNFITNDLSFNNIALAQDFPNGLAEPFGGKGQFRVIGFFGRVNYSLDETYYLSASLRREGSTRFGENNKWGNFPSVSAGVVLSNLFEADAVDNLKLRVGYGVTGALPRDNYLAQLTYGQSGSFFFNGNFLPAIGPVLNPNPNLRWETKGEFNAGLDFGFLDYKLTGSIDYYNQVTSDLMYNLPVDATTNLAPITYANLDDVELQNQGVELSLSYNMTTESGFSWEPTITFGTYNTVLNRIDVSDDAEFVLFNDPEVPYFEFSTSPGAPGMNNNPAVAIIADEQIGQLWGFVYDGVDDNGNYILRDIDGDGAVDEALVGNNPDRQVIGNGLPSFTYGFVNSFKYNNFDFSFFLRGDVGHDLANMYRLFYESNTSNRSIENIVITDNFNEDLTATPINMNSYYVEDASYMVLDNLTLGYKVPLAEGSAVSAIRLYVTGRNLFWITNYTGANPEPRFNDSGSTDNGGQNFDPPNPLAPGLDRRNQFFTTRSFTFGLNLDF